MLKSSCIRSMTCFPRNRATLKEWMDDLRFYVLFNSISVIAGRWAGDNERLCEMEPRIRFRKFRLGRGSNSGPPDQ